MQPNKNKQCKLCRIHVTPQDMRTDDCMSPCKSTMKIRQILGCGKCSNKDTTNTWPWYTLLYQTLFDRKTYNTAVPSRLPSQYTPTHFWGDSGGPRRQNTGWGYKKNDSTHTVQPNENNQCNHANWNIHVALQEQSAHFNAKVLMKIRPILVSDKCSHKDTPNTRLWYTLL